jgi:TonB-linked SusC/RagA family outer membrane protein
MRKSVLLLVSFLFLSVTLFAQSRIVSGKVLMPSGEPAVGATVTFKGFNKGTATGTDGTFNISVPASVKVMIISGIGIAKQEVDVSGKTELGSISLTNSSKVLDEVVVVAYGQSKKTNVTGAISTVNGGEIADKPFSSPDKALQGEVAGVQVSSASGAPGSATDILIRGLGSLTASASPLWVIDGAIANSGDYAVNTVTSNILATLNPDDIESISVLKDASATAIYGSKGANGVILVSTKRGHAGKTRVTFSAETGNNSIAFLPSNKSCTTPEYQTLMREAVINAGLATTTAQADAFITSPNGYGVEPANYTDYNTNWLKQVTRTGNQSQYNLSVSGGDEKTQVYLSAGYFKQIGEVIASSYTRANGAFNITHHANNWLTVSAVVDGGASTQHTPFNSGFFDNPALAARFILPWYTPFNADGTPKYNDSLNQFPLNAGPWNPMYTQKYNKNQYQQTNLRGNVGVEVKILPNLKFTSRYAAEYTDISEDQYLNPFYGDGYSTKGFGESIYTRIYDYTWSNFADWRQRLNKGDDVYFDLKVGYEAYQFNEYQINAQGQNYPITLALQYLASAATPLVSSVAPSDEATTSIFSAGDINYKDRYVLTGSFRRDGSSVFGANHPEGNFYSVGGTWNISNEHFMQSMASTIPLLKLRGSYGQVGNANGFGFYSALPTYSYGANYNNNPGSSPAQVGNANLTWEKINTADVGVDVGLIQDRIVATFDYYDRKTVNLIQGVPLSPTSGFGSVNENIGSMSNKGVEFTIDVKPVRTRTFLWDLSFNIAHNTNKILSLYSGKPIANGLFNYSVGHDAQEYYLRQWGGVNPANGAPQWYTDGTKATITGSFDSSNLAFNSKFHADPSVYGGLTNTLSWKGLSFIFQLTYNFGNSIFYAYGNYLNSDGLYLTAFNQDEEQLKSWQKPGDHVLTPQIIAGGNNNSNGTSTRFLYNGKYIRMRNIELDYSLPKSLIGKAKLDGLTIYIRGTNLFTFDTDKEIPFDPETGVNSTTNFEEYIPKTIVGGIKVAF